MTEKNSKTEKEKNEIISEVLSNGVKVEVDFSKANGHLLMKCRKASDYVGTAIYIMSEIATFDNETIPAPELLNLPDYIVMEIEAIYNERKKK